MRIGILTYWDTQENYGQVLQSYALMKVLSEMGHDPVLIRTRRSPVRMPFYHRFLTLLQYVKSPGIILKRKKKVKKKEGIVDRKFNEFKDHYIKSTENVYTYNDLLANIQQPFDVYIVGSDQVWGGLSPMMYLQFVANGETKISYAASFGGYRPRDNYEWKMLKDYLKSFNLITVRESDGVNLCNDLRLTSYLVPDPTLLLKSDDYTMVSKKADTKNRSNKYILLYLLGNSMDFDVADVYNFAYKNNLDVIYIASQGRIDGYEKKYPSIEEWLALYCNASFVITNSYHGTIFSLLYNKQFLTIPLSGSFSRMNRRIYDLLNIYHLEERVYSNNLDILFSPIDYSKFEEIREANARNATELLVKFIN